jgi:hypothetical protein
MPSTDPERTQRGRNLVLYGMFSLVLVTFVSSFLVLAVIMKRIDPTFFDGSAITRMALIPALSVTGVAIVACLVGWLVYTRLYLKD